MFKTDNYRMGFDVWGLTLFLAIMLPNFIWFAVPAAHDVLRNKSATPHIDRIASVFQVIMAVALIAVINKHRQRPMNKVLLAGIVFLLVVYYVGWCLYYTGNTSPAVILDLSMAPCLVFISFSIARKNLYALFSASIFMIYHVIYDIVNCII